MKVSKCIIIGPADVSNKGFTGIVEASKPVLVAQDTVQICIGGNNCKERKCRRMGKQWSSETSCQVHDFSEGAEAITKMSKAAKKKCKTGEEMNTSCTFRFAPTLMLSDRNTVSFTSRGILSGLVKVIKTSWSSSNVNKDLLDGDPSQL